MLSRIRRSKKLLPLLALTWVWACIDETSTFFTITLDATRSNVDFIMRGDDLRMQLDVEMFVEVYGEGEVHIDSATVTTTVDGVAVVFDDPDVTTDDFPIVDEASFLVKKATFEIPSPIPDPSTFEAHCASSGRTVALDVSFYATQSDRTSSDEPPLFQSSFTLPLLPTTLATPSEVFGSPGVMRLPEQPSQVGASVASVSQSRDDNVLALIERSKPNAAAQVSGTYELFRADGDSIGASYGAYGSFFDRPRVAMRADGGTVLGARASEGAIDLVALDSEDNPQSFGSIAVDWAIDPEYSALRLASLGRSPNGMYAVIQSAFPILREDSALTPPAGKYYGSFLIELADDLVVLSAQALDRDLLSIERLEDGTTLQVSTELPPREAPAAFRVERLDLAGDLLWSHEEPALVYAPVVRPLTDGGVLFAYEDEAFRGRINVVRLSGEDGSEVWRYSALGTSPSVAARGDGGAILSFVGLEPAVEPLARAVPLLVELSPSGQVVRGAQIACGGLGTVIDAADGSTMLIGTFTERMDLGSRVTEVTPLDFVVSAVE